MTENKHQIKCALCGKTIISKEIIVEIIDKTCCTFDTNDCILMFKKISGIYGSEFIGYCLQQAITMKSRLYVENISEDYETKAEM